MIIDSHHHFWKYDPVEYNWIDDSMKKIREDFLPEKFKLIIQEAGVDGVVSIQARQSIEETDWLIKLANQNNFIKGIIGWLPLIQNDIEDYLEKYSEKNILKGVRHVIQGETDPDFLLRKDFNNGVSLLKKYSLAYDILILEWQLPTTIRFIDQHPDQVFILDHIAKPLIHRNELSPWKENLKDLAKRENISCKLSGMVTEADFLHWTPSQLQPYFDVIIEAFGPDRLLFGSDWPVCTVAISYKEWIELVKKNLSGFSEPEKSKIMGGNAINLYKLYIDESNSNN